MNIERIIRELDSNSPLKPVFLAFSHCNMTIQTSSRAWRLTSILPLFLRTHICRLSLIKPERYGTSFYSLLHIMAKPSFVGSLHLLELMKAILELLFRETHSTTRHVDQNKTALLLFTSQNMP